MAEASPGPGYWLASDGKWYPPRWEYNWVMKYHENSVTAVEMLAEASDQLAQRGREMVSYTLQGTPGTPRFAFTASAMFKRRVIRS